MPSGCGVSRPSSGLGLLEPLGLRGLFLVGVWFPGQSGVIMFRVLAL